MPTSASISVASHAPDHGDGTIWQGDTVVFAITSTQPSWLVSLVGYRDGVVIISGSLASGVAEWTIAPSTAWLYSPGPLTVQADLRALVHHSVRTLASVAFEVAG